MMRELTAFEIENVSGAGWLQDGLAALGAARSAQPHGRWAPMP